MTESTEKAVAAEESTNERRRAPDTAGLAGSSPDVNHMFFGFLGRLLALVQSDTAPGWIRGTAIGIIGWLVTLLLLFVVGITALQGTTILWDKITEGKTAEREFQLEMFKLQADIEIKKLDRTLLGDAATKTLGEISKKLDDQAVKMDNQGAQIAKVVADVQTLKDAQDATARRLSGVAAKQGALERRLSPPPE